MGKPKGKRGSQDKRGPGKPRKYGAGDGQICVPLTISVPRWIRDWLDEEPEGRSAAVVGMVLERAKAPHPPSE
jgi:hypothetical protein